MAKTGAGGYRAYSLRVARQRIEQGGGDWRKASSEVLKLAGINRVEGFVYDETHEDLILVGHQEAGRAELTLDDLVVALRARFRYGQWPLVSIDPTPDTPKTQMQHVRYEGGIEGTAFGRALYEADYKLKEVSFGLAESGVPGIRIPWDALVQEADNGRSIPFDEWCSRFWFYPVNPRVTVREGVCEVRGLKIGVFTEVLSGKLHGNDIKDASSFKFPTNEAFAADISEWYESLCEHQPWWNLLRGLQELVALSAALESLESRPDLTWWLDDYRLATEQTPKQVACLRRGNQYFRFEGGVHLTALALRLNAGDVTALREAVFYARPRLETLSWDFVVAEWVVSTTGATDRAKQSEMEISEHELASLLAQGTFLLERQRNVDAVSIFDTVLGIMPNCVEAFHNKGSALYELGRYQEALECCDRVVQLAPGLVEGYNNRGRVYCALREYRKAIDDLDHALRIDPHHISAYVNRAAAYSESGLSVDKAMHDFDQALALDANCVPAVYGKGNLYCKELGDYERGITEFNNAIAMDPTCSNAYISRGTAYITGRRDFRHAIDDFNMAIDLNPTCAVAYRNRGQIYAEALNDYERALVDLNKAVQYGDLESYCARGNTFCLLGQLDQAIQDFDSLLQQYPGHAGAHIGRGIAFKRKGDVERARADYLEAIRLDPAASDAYANLGSLCADIGDHSQALDWYGKALQFDSNQAECHANYAVSLFALGRYRDARESLDRAIAMNPKEAAWYYNRAVVLFQEGEYQKSLEDVRESKRLGYVSDGRLEAALTRTLRISP